MIINDVFNQWMNKGIFYYLNNLDVPWKKLNINEKLDLAYHGFHSGGKIISPFVSRIVNVDDVKDSDLQKLADTIYTYYIDNWNRLFETIKIEYNPIENYSMTEIENIVSDNDSSYNGSINIVNSETQNNEVTESNENNATKTLNGTNVAHNNSSVYGFNSNTSVNYDKNDGDSTISNNEIDVSENTRSENTHITDNMTSNNTSSNTSKNTSINDRELTRKGNIGVMSTQDMIQKERNVLEWLFYETIFKHIDKLLTISIY